MVNFKPLNNQVVVELDKEQEKIGTLFIPHKSVEAPVTGTVIAVGMGKLYEGGNRYQMNVKEGDKVMFGKFAGTDLEIDGKKIIVLHDEDIMAVIEG